MKGKCKSCVRYNPKAMAHCKMSQSIFNLEKRLGVSMYVTKCREYLEPKEVFSASRAWEAKDVIKEDCECEDYAKYGTCECEGDD